MGSSSPPATLTLTAFTNVAAMLGSPFHGNPQPMNRRSNCGAIAACENSAICAQRPSPPALTSRHAPPSLPANESHSAGRARRGATLPNQSVTSWSGPEAPCRCDLTCRPGRYPSRASSKARVGGRPVRHPNEPPSGHSAGRLRVSPRPSVIAFFLPSVTGTTSALTTGPRPSSHRRRRRRRGRMTTWVTLPFRSISS